jgi:hypothetical protein
MRGRRRSRRRYVLDLHGLFEQAVEEQATVVGAAPVEAEGKLVEVEVELLRSGGALVSASSQRFSSEETRCAHGMTTCAGSPLAAMLVR